MEKMEEKAKQKEKEELEKLRGLENQTINIVYLNNTIENFELPIFFEEFRTQIKQMFQIENENEEIMVVYSTLKEEEKKKNKEKIQKEKIFEVKRIEEYVELLKKIKSEEVIDDTIYIETDRVPDEISRETPQTFEEEIQCLIETHLKAATERIKKGLSGKSSLNPSSNKTNYICSKCGVYIIGNVFRVVNETEQKTICSKCSFQNGNPMFIIN